VLFCRVNHAAFLCERTTEWVAEPGGIVDRLVELLRMYVLFAKFLVDEDSPFVAGKVSQEPVDTEVNSACVSQSLTIQKSDTQPTAQRADNDCGVMVTGVKEKKTIPCERTTDDIRGPMLPNKQSRVEEHAALEVPPFKALKEKSVISDPDSDDGKMTSGADHSPEFICPQTVSSTAEVIANTLVYSCYTVL
jgi:hypothetical protein